MHNTRCSLLSGNLTVGHHKTQRLDQRHYVIVSTGKIAVGLLVEVRSILSDLYPTSLYRRFLRYEPLNLYQLSLYAYFYVVYQVCLTFVY